MTDSDKERTKLMATALNNLGIATLTIGVVTPGVAYLYGVGPAPALQKIVLFSAFFISIAVTASSGRLRAQGPRPMTVPEIYIIGLMIFLLACAYGMMRWNRYIVRSHKARERDQL